MNTQQNTSPDSSCLVIRTETNDEPVAINEIESSQEADAAVDTLQESNVDEPSDTEADEPPQDHKFKTAFKKFWWLAPVLGIVLVIGGISIIRLSNKAGEGPATAEQTAPLPVRAVVTRTGLSKPGSPARALSEPSNSNTWLLTRQGKSLTSLVAVGVAPLLITHRNGQRTVTVFSKVASRTTGEILADLEPRLEAMKQSWPQSYTYSFGGETEDQAETFGSAGQAIIMVFAVLVLQFSSFRQPFIILMAIPFALIGTFGGFFLAWIPFSFTAFIGIIALVGIVVNDAIVMVDTMNSYQKQGMKVRQAAAHGVADRLRPILTTSITTIIGLVPLALSNPTWLPLCSAIIFGLIAATVIALFVIPGLYLQLTPKTETRDFELA